MHSENSFKNKPFTINCLVPGIYCIEDSWTDKPAGRYINKQGIYSVNNCSNVYLVIGSRRAAMFDFSNPSSYSEADVILYSIVKLLSKGLPLSVFATHNHFDHLGLTQRFVRDSEIDVYMPEGDFASYNVFPKQRTTLLKGGEIINLGDLCIKSFHLPGHTIGSMMYVVENMNIVLSGDALGSGKFLWIFYKRGLNDFISNATKFRSAILNSDFGLDKNLVSFYSGHSWQNNYKCPDFNYLNNLITLAQKMISGEIVPKKYRSPMVYIDSVYSYGEVSICCERL